MEEAEYVPGLPVRLAIDCGLSRHVGALCFQVRERDGATPGAVRRILSVFGDYYAVDRTSCDNALAIKERSYQLCGGRIDHVYLDPGVDGPERRRAGGARGVRPGPGRADHRVLAVASRPRGARPARDPPGGPAPRARPVDPPAVPVPHRELPDLSAGRAARGDPRRAGRSPAPGRGGHRRAARGRAHRLPRGRGSSPARSAGTTCGRGGIDSPSNQSLAPTPTAGPERPRGAPGRRGDEGGA